MLDKVREVMADTLGCDIDTITLETSLKEDLELDSLDAVDLNMALEEAFEVSISDEELAGLKTVDDIIKIITEKTK